MTAVQSLRALGGPFLRLWVGQTASMLGSAMTGFATSIWVFQHSHQLLDFASMVALSVLPSALLAPWAGTIADRFDRRLVLLAASSVAALTTCVMALLLWHDSLQVWHLYGLSIARAIANTFQMPAYQALASSMLQEGQLPRASGLMGVSANIVRLLTPSLAALAIGAVGLRGIVVIDLFSFFVGALLVLWGFSALVARSPQEEQRGQLMRQVVQDFAEVLRFFKAQTLMLALLGYFALQASLIALVLTLIAPLVLTEHSALDLASVMTTGALGGLIGSSLLVVFKHPARPMLVMIACDGLLSGCITFAGLFRSMPVYLGCAFVAEAAAAVAGGLALALWMRQVPQQRQGRVFAFVGLVCMLVVPVTVLAGSLLADQALGPLLRGASAGSELLALQFGTGTGGPLALLFAICGTLGVLVSMGSLAHPRIRSVDRQVPAGTDLTTSSRHPSPITQEALP